MHGMEGGAYAYATQYDTEGAQGTILYSQFASPESQWVVTETGVNSNDKFPLINFHDMEIIGLKIVAILSSCGVRGEESKSWSWAFEELVEM